MQRRDFLQSGIKAGIGFGAGVTILSGSASAQGTTANSKINIALVGCGGRGTALLHGFNYPNNTRITGFQEFPEAGVLYTCDVQKSKAENAAKGVKEKHSGVKIETEYQKILDDKSVDAVVSALPDHWHALGAVLAMQAGKDVYTEKPASHSGWEGQKMVEAARKYKRICQVGLQNRSAPYNFAAKKYIEDGKLGKIHLVRVYNQKREMNSFKIKAGEPVPAGLDWSAWLGPAKEQPYSSTLISRNWHERWDFSSGDVLNDGVHQIDLARWLAGVEIPKNAYAAGGRYTDQNSDAQTPDTLLASYEFDGLIFTVEATHYTDYIYKIDGEVRQTDTFPYWQQCATRIELFGTEGVMFVGRHGGGWQVFGKPKNRGANVVAQEFGRFPEPEHKRNFFDCIKSRELPNCDIEKGHRSTALVHYSTVSYRLGGIKLDIDTTTGIPKNSEAAQYWKRDYRAPYIIPEEV